MPAVDRGPRQLPPCCKGRETGRHSELLDILVSVPTARARNPPIPALLGPPPPGSPTYPVWYVEQGLGGLRALAMGTETGMSGSSLYQPLPLGLPRPLVVGGRPHGLGTRLELSWPQ